MVNLPPNDDPVWDIVKEHGIPVTVFKVVLRVLLEKRKRELERAADGSEETEH